MPPFTLPALETSIGKRVAVPAHEIRLFASEIFDRYDNAGPAGAPWHPQRVTLVEGGEARYDLCRGEWSGGIYSSPDQAVVQFLADALNELDGHDSDATGSQ